MRRLSEALLLALLLLAVQTAILTHDHGGRLIPAETTAQPCEFCTGTAAAAPESAEADHATYPSLRNAVAPDLPLLPSRSLRAHLSRAPPQFRSS